MLTKDLCWYLVVRLFATAQSDVGYFISSGDPDLLVYVILSGSEGSVLSVNEGSRLVSGC